MSFLSQYDVSCHFGENFLIIRFHSPAFTFVFAFAFTLVTWAAFCTYVSFCVEFCEFCMTCDVCKTCIFCKICKFFVICFALIFFLMFSAFCWINCRMRKEKIQKLFINQHWDSQLFTLKTSSTWCSRFILIIRSRWWALLMWRQRMSEKRVLLLCRRIQSRRRIYTRNWTSCKYFMSSMNVETTSWCSEERWKDWQRW